VGLPLPLKLTSLECSFQFEKKLNLDKIAGVDEVGRGCLAGPVVIAGVVLCKSIREIKNEKIDLIRDSKKLSAVQREDLAQFIEKEALAYEVVMIPEVEIDSMNILQATLYGARKVVEGLEKKLGKPLDMVLMDGNQKIPGVTSPQRALVAGDSLSKSIAAASILAKVFRDRWMIELSKTYPHYGFEQHKGYGTAFHLEALEEWGPSAVHRLSFLNKFFNRKEMGASAEAQVGKFLEKKGFKILKRNWTCPIGEIDLILQNGKSLHFVEVRARTSIRSLDMAFPPRKQEKFKRLAEFYLAAHGLSQGSTDFHLDFVLVNQEGIQPYWDVFKW